MGVRELISSLSLASALMPSTTINEGTKRRRFAEHTHFTPKQWAHRKKRLKMQKESRKINRSK